MLKTSLKEVILMAPFIDILNNRDLPDHAEQSRLKDIINRITRF